MSSNKLYIMSGLPGVGKTTLAQSLASRIGAFYLRIDTIEQALRDLCDIDVEAQGYELAYRIAKDNLELGMSVIADSCNCIDLTRQAWQHVAESACVEFKNIEIVCSNTDEHRSRIENRVSSIENHALPDWQSVLDRRYDVWKIDRILIDTAGSTPQASVLQLGHALDLIP